MQEYQQRFISRCVQPTTVATITITVSWAARLLFCCTHAMAIPNGQRRRHIGTERGAAGIICCSSKRCVPNGTNHAVEILLWLHQLYRTVAHAIWETPVPIAAKQDFCRTSFYNRKASLLSSHGIKKKLSRPASRFARHRSV